MKNLIKLMLLMGLTASLNLWSMSEKPLSKKENLAEEKEKEELVQIKTIEFPNKGLRKVVTLNIAEKEVLTGKTFAELIEAKARKNESFILARVVTKVGNAFVVHCVDGHALNKRLFGYYPIINMPTPLNLNPINEQQIKNIEYFTIKKNEHSQELNKYLPEVLSNIVMDYQECFEYLCCDRDLVSDGQEYILDYFYLNSDDLNFNLINGLVRQANKHYNLKDYKKAKEYYEKVATAEVKNINLAAWAAANNNLGIIYYFGKLGAPDYQRAKEYYEKVATAEVKNVNLALAAWASANNGLADIYYFGNLEAPDYQRAKEYYEKVVTAEVKNVNLNAWAIANNNLADIYYFGRLGAPDFQKAKEYWEKVATVEVKNVNLAEWASANNNLGTIYYFGRLGAPDFQKAKEYWEKVATAEVKNVNLAAWNHVNKRLEELEKIIKEKSDKSELVN